MCERFFVLDGQVFALVHHALWGTIWLPLLQIVQYAGEGLGMTVLFVSAFLLAPKGRRFELVFRILGPLLAAVSVAEGLKRVVYTARPVTLYPELVLNKGPLPKWYSWPSGHTTAVFAFAMAVLMLRLSRTLPPRRWTLASGACFVVACLTGLARVAVGAHFPSDVVGGALIGCVVSYLSCRVIDEVASRRRAPAQEPSEAAQSLH